MPEQPHNHDDQQTDDTDNTSDASDQEPPLRLDMHYPELVEEAIQIDGPVTQVSQSGRDRTIYRAVQYDQATQTAWMCYIDVDTYPERESSPTIHFSRCHPRGKTQSLREWTSVATGRLSGPQTLTPWKQLFAVFTAAHQLYQEPRDDGSAEVSNAV